MDNLRGKVYLIRVMAKSDMMAHGVKGNIQDKENYMMRMKKSNMTENLLRENTVKILRINNHNIFK